MKNAKLILIILFVLSSQLLLSQDKHITYLGNIYSISHTKDENNKLKSNCDKRKGYYNILVLKDKKAISYQYDTIQSKQDSAFNKGHYSATVFTKKQTRHLSFFHNKIIDKYIFNKFTSNWHKTRPDLKPLYNKETAYMKTIYIEAGIDTTFKAPIVEYTDKTKELKGYHCKNAIITSHNDKYIVWYTEEIDYHWCFDDFCALIPGTPILIEYKNEPYLEFVSIKDLDYEKIYIEKDVTNFILKNWNKKIKQD